MSDQPGMPPSGPVALDAPRPTRAEMRRAAEAAAAAPPVMSAPGASGAGGPSHYGTATPGAPPAPAPSTAMSRLEQRRLADESARAHRSQRAIWKAWWVYPLAAAIAICVWFGVQSAAHQPDTTPRVVTTITAQP